MFILIVGDLIIPKDEDVSICNSLLSVIGSEANLNKRYLIDRPTTLTASAAHSHVKRSDILQHILLINNICKCYITS